MNVETAKMSERGQIIIPKEVREEIGAIESTVFVVSTLDKDTIVMKKLDTKEFISKFNAYRRKHAKLSPSEIEAEIHAYRKEKSRS